MKSWQITGLFLITAMFVGATINRDQTGHYEYATLELRCSKGQYENDYMMTWRDSDQTIDADSATKDRTTIPLLFFRKLDLPFNGSKQTRTLEHFLSLLGAKGWQIHTVKYSTTDATQHISSYLMMRQIQ
jgi:hypothetical protein